MGEMLIFLFVNCLVAALMYADDGYCETFNNDSDCEAARTTGNFFQACEWRTDNESCEFKPPEIDFYSTIVLTIIASMLVVPFEKLLHYSVVMIAQHYHYRKLNSRIAPGDNPVEHILQPRFDEFALAQTMRSTLFRAARLEKARRLMDFTLPVDEAELVQAKISADEERWMNNHAFRGVVEQASSQQTRYGFTRPTRKVILRKIETCRDQVTVMKTELDRMDSAEDQEMYLMRNFIVDVFDGPRRGVVSRHFLEQYHTRRTLLWEYASLVFLPVMLAVMIYYVYVFNLSIGSRATNMWLVVTSINFIQDVFFLKPLKVWVNFVLINGTVSHEVRELCERLSRRSKLIMMRTHGMVRDADALVQHFNPACRAARMYPALPISRLLMSLNDHDIPNRTQHSWFLLPYMYFMTGLLSLTLLPEVLQESSLEILSGAVLDFGAIGFYQLGSVSTIAAVVLAIAIVAIIVFREWRARGYRWRTNQHRVGVQDWSFQENMFHTLDEGSEEDAPAALFEKTLSGPPKEFNRAKASMKGLVEVNSQLFNDSSDEEEAVVVSDLINFDGVDEILADSSASARLFDPKALQTMNSVASLQSFKRPPRSPNASFMLGAQLDTGGSLFDDNSSFYTELQSHSYLAGMNSRRNSRSAQSRSSSRALSSTYHAQSGLLVPGMTAIAGPPIASFDSPNASMFEQNIASSMTVNSRLGSVGSKYRTHSFGSDDVPQNEVRASSCDAEAVESKDASPMQTSRNPVGVTAAEGGWFRSVLYSGASIGDADDVSYSKPFSAVSTRYAHPLTSASGLFGAAVTSGYTSTDGPGLKTVDSWVRKGRPESPGYYIGDQDLPTEGRPSSHSASFTRGASPAPKSPSRGKPDRNAIVRSRRSQRTLRSRQFRNRSDSNCDIGDTFSVLTDDRSVREGRFSGSSSPNKPVIANKSFVYRKYAGRSRRRGDSGSFSAMLDHHAGAVGPGGHSAQVRNAPDDFDLSMQQNYHSNADISPPMPVMQTSTGAGATTQAEERFGMLAASVPTVPSGPGGFLYSSGEQRAVNNSTSALSTAQNSAFPMFQ